MTTDEIYSILCKYKFATDTEDRLQLAIAHIFKEHHISFIREYKMNATDRLDFLIGTIALETKIKGSLSEVTRQLHRYAQDEKISEIILVTNKSNHLKIPPTINEKRIMKMWIGGSSL